MRMAVVASLAYLAARGASTTPRDLADHRCINLRFPTHGGLYASKFEYDGRELSVRVEGQVIVNGIALAHHATLDGAGVAYLPEDLSLPMWKPIGYSACWRTGARHSQATTSDISNGGSFLPL